MRELYNEQLEYLHNELVEMGALCERAIEKVIKACMEGDMETAEAVMKGDDVINHKESEIERLCFMLLLKQQPVARDLRKVSAALKVITDMERIGDQAQDIAEIVSESNVKAYHKLPHIEAMGAAAVEMVHDSIQAYVNEDLELAKRVIASDDVVDGLFNKVKNDLVSFIGENKENPERAIDLLMIAKYLERIGDHATNIAESVEFFV